MDWRKNNIYFFYECFVRRGAIAGFFYLDSGRREFGHHLLDGFFFLLSSARPRLRRRFGTPTKPSGDAFLPANRPGAFVRRRVAFVCSERHLRTRLGGGGGRDKNIITDTIGFCVRRTRRVSRTNEAEIVNDERFAAVNHRRRIGRDSSGSNGFEPAHTRPTNERAGVTIFSGRHIHEDRILLVDRFQTRK